MIDVTCKTCIFADAVLRQCRRYPPGATVGASRILPSISDQDWCGEHRADLAGREPAPAPASAKPRPKTKSRR